MGREYSMVVIEQAEVAYCIERRSFSEISLMTGIAASTLKRWSSLYGWQEKKRQARATTLAAKTFVALAGLVKESLAIKVFDSRRLRKILDEAGFHKIG